MGIKKLVFEMSKIEDLTMLINSYSSLIKFNDILLSNAEKDNNLHVIKMVRKSLDEMRAIVKEYCILYLPDKYEALIKPIFEDLDNKINNLG